MGNAVFVVWRESIEAMLVIGILAAWLRRNEDAGTGRHALWLGVGGGLALAFALGWAMLSVQGELSGAALEWFQTAILFIAAGLIVQMVLWMQKHGRRLKQSLEQELARAHERSGAWGIALVAALAIAREGAETVIFLYGMGLEESGRGQLFGGAALGLLLALLTAWAIDRGLRFLSYRHFFQFSGLLLLLLGAALLVSGVERLIGVDWLPPLLDPAWSSAWLLDDGSRLGALVAAFTGYRAQPSLTLVLIYAVYWGGIALVQRRMRRHG